MSETPEPKSQQKPRNPSSIAAFYQIWIVFAAAIILATLFTAWTPGDEPANQRAEEIIPEAASSTPTAVTGSTQTARTTPLIGIVSGHWGNDSGATCADGLTEAEVNQTIATLVQKYLVDFGYEVDLLREFDPRLDGYQASALVSIHADSCNFINDQASGFKVASALASTNREQSTRLTACIRSRYHQATGLQRHSTSLTPDMTSYHAFAEINPTTPAAIIETGFLNLDRHLLTQQPDKAALGIVNGILCFLNNESISPTPTPSSP